MFDRIAAEQGRLDILVNNVWGGYERMTEEGEFTWTLPFWRQPLWRWDAMFSAGWPRLTVRSSAPSSSVRSSFRRSRMPVRDHPFSHLPNLVTRLYSNAIKIAVIARCDGRER